MKTEEKFEFIKDYLFKLNKNCFMYKKEKYLYSSFISKWIIANNHVRLKNNKIYDKLLKEGGENELILLFNLIYDEIITEHNSKNV